MAQSKKKSSNKLKSQMAKQGWTPSKIAILVAVIGLAGAILGPFIGIIPNIFKPSLPEFRVNKHIFHPDSTMIVEAINGAAQKNKPFVIRIDGYACFPENKPEKIKGKFCWKIDLPLLNLPQEVRADGEHEIEFGFSQNNMGPNQKIYFDSKDPQVAVKYNGKFPNEKRITGKVIDDSPAQNQSISVEVDFRYQEKMHTERLPVRTFVDASGRTMYEFEYNVQNIPQISKNDPEYNKPFFALTVKDEAGNKIRHTSTYGAFIAEGVQTFQTTSAEVMMQKVDNETNFLANGGTKRVEKKPPRKIAVGPPLIILRVVIRAHDYVKLSWNRLPKDLRAEPEEYLMLKQNRAIGTSFDTTFTDRNISSDSTYNYQILARGRDDKYYPSNVLPLSAMKGERKIVLRSIPTSLSAEDVRSMLKIKDFFDVQNKNSKGIENQFEAGVINGDKVIIDHATGLMWQQNGSSDYLNYEDAKNWIKKLNGEGFAGFHDWRLPTLEEGMSLMEPWKNSARLYIDSIFDDQQRWIWTCDQLTGESWAWVVYFGNGECNYSPFGSSYSYVRAVRSGQSSLE